MARRKRGKDEEQQWENPTIKHDANGGEILDTTPVAVPVRFLREENIFEEVRRVIRQELSNEAATAGFESFEEADDFDVGDDYEPTSDYELDADQENYHAPARNEGSDDSTEASSGEGDQKTEGNVQRERKKTPRRGKRDQRDQREAGGSDDDGDED